MAKLCVITGTAQADGFRLAGAEVHPADGVELARSVLLSLVKREDVGMVAVDADLYGALDARTKARLEGRYPPVVIALPASTWTAQSERRARYIRELIQRAIGVKVTVRGGG